MQEKWYTIIEVVDVDTGEIIPKERRNEYIVLKEYTKIENNNNYKIKTYVRECKHNGQQKFEF